MWTDKQKMLAFLVVVALALGALAMYKKSCACAAAAAKTSAPAADKKKVIIVEPSSSAAGDKTETANKVHAETPALPEPMLSS